MKPARPPAWSWVARMSGVFGQRFGRKYSTTSVVDSSVKYRTSSAFVVRQVK